MHCPSLLLLEAVPAEQFTAQTHDRQRPVLTIRHATAHVEGVIVEHLPEHRQGKVLEGPQVESMQLVDANQLRQEA
jgi:hypothetical protein